MYVHVLEKNNQNAKFHTDLTSNEGEEEEEDQQQQQQQQNKVKR